MGPRLFNLAAAVSLVLCVATCALWVRSFWVGDSFHWQTVESGGPATFTSRGRIAFWLMTKSAPGGVGGNAKGWQSHPNPPPFDWSYLPRHEVPFGHFGITVETWKAATADNRWVTMHLSLIALCAAVLPFRFARLHLRANRAQRLAGWACVICGYDLRATPDRCPECGTKAKPQPAQGAPA